MDFRDGRYLGTDIEDSTLQTARGYDHNWVIGTGYSVPHKVLTATGDQSGISMDLSTDIRESSFTLPTIWSMLQESRGIYTKQEMLCASSHNIFQMLFIIRIFQAPW